VKCPVDNTDLTISDRQGVEIDFCPQCRGVWLDRGELDKILERSSTFTRRDDDDDPRGRGRNRRDDDDDDEGGIGGFFGRLFDFGG
jgi:Zn-finger nucleic acid-binding protein